MNKIITLTIVLLILVNCKQNEQKDPNNSQKIAPEITSTGSNKGQAFIKDDDTKPSCLQIALESADHKTLVAAVQAVQLENALVNAGPLTVFAPTDAAFEALPEGTVDNLVKPENKAALSNILKYHVTPGNLSTKLLKSLKKVGQANGQNIPITKKDGELYIGEAKIIASVPAGNGIVHVIDKVLLPPEKK